MGLNRGEVAPCTYSRLWAPLSGSRPCCRKDLFCVLLPCKARVDPAGPLTMQLFQWSLQGGVKKVEDAGSHLVQ